MSAIGISNSIQPSGFELPVPSMLRIRLLGPMAITRNGEPLTLPSRKVRALLAFLVLSSRPVSRSRLCELLWDAPDDPRGELRWCLSKVRRTLDDRQRHRVEAQADAVALDLSDCFVDAIEIARTTQRDLVSADIEELTAVAELFTGELLEGLDLEDSPQFTSWLVAERHRLRNAQLTILKRLVHCSTGDDRFKHLQQWRTLAPCDQEVHQLLLEALAQCGRISEGDEHVEATARLFEAEGLNTTSLRAVWRAAKVQAASPAVVCVFQTPSTPGDGRDVLLAEVAPRRACIAVMPFLASGTDRNVCADGLVRDVITRLAKLRTFSVIAQGSVFSLYEHGVEPAEAARMLNVDYMVTGSLQRYGTRLRVVVELAQRRTARIVWSETFDQRLDDTLLILDEIGSRIVGSIASEIELNERNQAVLKPPSSLNAWEAYHRGLWHVYRFEKADNERARNFFELAVRLDPTFARAYAGLSFTHFQNAFQGWERGSRPIERALESAGRSLMADDRDPAAHDAMGRALWLRGMQEQSVAELRRAVDLSPNFALGHYALAFVMAQAGDARAAIDAADLARRLSPCDPMQYAMLCARAVALVRLERFDDAAQWALKAAARPNAHLHVQAVSAFSLALAGLLEQARSQVAAIRRTMPRYGLVDFLEAFKFDAGGAALFRNGAKLIGVS